jgi:hypothetical protein
LVDERNAYDGDDDDEGNDVEGNEANDGNIGKDDNKGTIDKIIFFV